MSELLTLKLILAAALVGGGVTQIWLARATASGRLGRNRIAGIRNSTTMASDESWLAAHRAARSASETGGWCALAAGPVALIAPSLPLLVAVALAATGLALTFIAIGALRGGRAAQEVSRGADELST